MKLLGRKKPVTELDPNIFVTKRFKILGLTGGYGRDSAMIRTEEGLLDCVCIYNVKVAEDVSAIVGAFIECERFIDTDIGYSNIRIISGSDIANGQ